MFDRLTNGRSFRTLNILDDFNREIVNIVIDTSISSARVAKELSQMLNGEANPIRLESFSSEPGGGYSSGNFEFDERRKVLSRLSQSLPQKEKEKEGTRYNFIE